MVEGMPTAVKATDNAASTAPRPPGVGTAEPSVFASRKMNVVSTGLVCILGITEPALYGIALPEKRPLFAAMAGGAVAGAVAVLMGVVTYAFSMPGITSVATYMDGGNNFLKLLVVMAVAWGSSFAISFILTKKER